MLPQEGRNILRKGYSVQASFVQIGNLVRVLDKKASVTMGRGSLAIVCVFQIPCFPNKERLSRVVQLASPLTLLFV